MKTHFFGFLDIFLFRRYKNIYAFSFFQLPNMKVNPKGVIRYTLIPKQKYPPGASPAEITKHNMDSTHQLELFLQQFRRLVHIPNPNSEIDFPAKNVCCRQPLQ